jgi:3-deoxy-D-manno-octulosonic-acid transferase
MNPQLKQRLDAFRNDWSTRQAQRFRVRPEDSKEKKEQAQRIQDGLNERKRFIYEAFNNDERGLIAEYISELRPRVIENDPAALDPSHPERVREVDAETMDEFYFLREIFPD